MGLSTLKEQKAFEKGIWEKVKRGGGRSFFLVSRYQRLLDLIPSLGVKGRISLLVIVIGIRHIGSESSPKVTHSLPGFGLRSHLTCSARRCSLTLTR